MAPNNLSDQQLGWAEATEAIVPPDIWRFAEGIEGMRFTKTVIRDVNPVSAQERQREIWMPNESMLILHRRLLEHMRSLDIEMPFATGGRPGSSPATHVENHRSNRYFFLVDLKHAYDQVPAAPLASILADLDPSLGNPKAIAEFLRRFCIHPSGKGLLTGAPSSPELFNLYLAPLDDQLAEYCAQHSISYSRYLDDLCFSGSEKPAAIKVLTSRYGRKAIRSMLEVYGLRLNYRKTEVCDLEDGPVIITGLQLNPNGKWQLPTHYQRYIYNELKILESYLKTGLPFSEEQRGHFAGLLGLLRASLDDSRAMRTEQENELIILAIKLKARNRAYNAGNRKRERQRKRF